MGDVSGQIGDLVFSKIRKKRVVKKKSPKKNNHTEPRQRTESLFCDLPKVWSGMKRAERKTWEELVICGNVFLNSKLKHIDDGSALFMSFNRNLQEAEEPILRLAPSEPVFPPLMFGTIIDVNINDNGTDIRMYNKTSINIDTKVILYATPILTSGKPGINSRLYRKIGVIDSTFENGGSISEKYHKIFPNIPEEGDEISFIFKSVHRSLGTASLPLSHIATARRQEIQESAHTENH